MLKEFITFVFTEILNTIINTMVNIAWEYAIIIFLALFILIVILLFVSNKEKHRVEMQRQKNEHVPLSLTKTKNVPCVHTRCNGHYVLRSGKYGSFAGCSEYPRCNSTMKIYELVLLCIQTHGIAIYIWEVKCKKCKNITPVYAYHLDHDLAKYSNFVDGNPMVALGDISYLDQLIMKKYPSIKEFNDRNNNNYVCNTCIHCGKKQSRGFFVQGPHDLAEEPWYNYGQEKLPYIIIKFHNIEPLRTDIKRIYG